MAHQVHITYYTDPLCVWSWAFEPQWRRLCYEFGAALSLEYVLAGMIPNWQQFADPLNAVSQPAHMGPLWFHARQLSGLPVDELIWVDDPPASSFPACIAVRAALRQGLLLGAAFLHRLRTAVMLERRNVARDDVLLDLATAFAADPHQPALDLDQFRADLTTAAVDDFRTDLKDVRYRDIGRFPTLIMRANGRALMIVGFRPYAALREAIAYIAPNCQPQQPPPSALDYVAVYGLCTAAEVACALERDIDTVEAELAAAVDAGALTMLQHTQGTHYQPSVDFRPCPS